MSRREGKFQAGLIKDIRKKFPGSFVLKTNPGHIQGMPDLLILYENRWAALECKKAKGASFRPNQQYYIDVLNKMSYAKAIYPENKEEVLHEIQQTFGI